MKRTWTIIGVVDLAYSFKWYQTLFGQPQSAPAHSYFGQILDWIAAENVRRAESKKRPIRIVQAPMYAAETLPKGFAAWALDAKARVTGLRGAVLAVLP